VSATLRAAMRLVVKRLLTPTSRSRATQTQRYASRSTR
jgi:hypothetical protein